MYVKYNALTSGILVKGPFSFKSSESVKYKLLPFNRADAKKPVLILLVLTLSSFPNRPKRDVKLNQQLHNRPMKKDSKIKRGLF